MSFKKKTQVTRSGSGGSKPRTNSGTGNKTARSGRANKAPRRKVRKKVLFFIFVLIVSLSCLAYFLVIDQLVSKRLARGDVSEGSKVWSDIEFFRRGQKIPLDYLRNLLTQRNYTLVGNQDSNPVTADAPKRQSTPLSPGEYSDAGKSIHLMTRPFNTISGSSASSSDITVNPASSDEFRLEPIALAHLGAEDSRASRFLPLSKTPKPLIDAVLAIEDERFYKHFGIDPIGIARAIATNILKGKFAQGGSTITQQLAKNLFFSSQRSLSRKLQEIPAALSLEWHLDKPKILEMYLNEVYMGQDGAIAIHGMGEAAHAFFGKPASDLSIAESATLAGMIQAPSLYAPKRYPDRAVKRRNIVLDKMCELHVLQDAECAQAKASPLKLVPDPEYKAKIPFYLSVIQENLSEKINMEAAIHQGVNIYTGIQPAIQECAESAIEHGVNILEKSHPGLVRKTKPLEAALVAIEPFSGKIKAWVGGTNFQRSQFDRVLKAKRQIGSTVKPFVYLTALDGTLNTYKTATAISILSDRPMELELQKDKYWNPENYDHEYRGDVTLRYALEHSLNVPAVYISQKFGVSSLAKVISQFNVQENPQDLPAIALGALDTSLLRLTSAYAALANGGIYVAPRLFTSAQDLDGTVLDSTQLDERQVANEGPVFVLTSILEGVVDRGTGTAVRKSGYAGPAAGKTGTTNDGRDAWFIGYTPELAAGVWIGFDDNKKMGLTGGVAAAPIWGEFMSCIAKSHSFIDFVPPPSVALLDINPESGLRVTNECGDVESIKEYFVRGTEPDSYCTSKNEPRVHEGEKDESLQEETSRRRERSLWDNLFN